MKKKVTIAALAVVLVILLIALIAFTGGKTEEVPAVETTAATEQETTAATVEVTVPGVEDSIFDDEPAETESTASTEETTAQKQSSSTDNTKATEPKATEPKATEPKATEPKATEPKATEPKATEPKATEPKATEPSEPDETIDATQSVEKVPSDSSLMEYKKFQNLSPSEQQKYVESFSSIEAFFSWYNAAKEEYENANPAIEVGSGTVDIGAIIEGNN